VIDYAVIAVLKDSPVVGAVCGDRVYPGQLPQRPRYPAIVIDVISDVPDYTQEGESGVAESRLQIDCHGHDAANADGWDTSRELAMAVKSALSGRRLIVATNAGGEEIQSSFLTNQRRFFSDVTQTQVVSMDLLIGYRD